MGSTIIRISAGTFRELKHLETLDLSANKLQILPRERLRGLSSLKVLNISANSLEKVDALPQDMENLKVTLIKYLTCIEYLT